MLDKRKDGEGGGQQQLKRGMLVIRDRVGGGESPSRLDSWGGTAAAAAAAAAASAAAHVICQSSSTSTLLRALPAPAPALAPPPPPAPAPPTSDERQLVRVLKLPTIVRRVVESGDVVARKHLPVKVLPSPVLSSHGDLIARLDDHSEVKKFFRQIKFQVYKRNAIVTPKVGIGGGGGQEESRSNHREEKKCKHLKNSFMDDVDDAYQLGSMKRRNWRGVGVGCDDIVGDGELGEEENSSRNRSFRSSSGQQQQQQLNGPRRLVNSSSFARDSSVSQSSPTPPGSGGSQMMVVKQPSSKERILQERIKKIMTSSVASEMSQIIQSLSRNEKGSKVIIGGGNTSSTYVVPSILKQIPLISRRPSITGLGLRSSGSSSSILTMERRGNNGTAGEAFGNRKRVHFSFADNII